MNARDAIKSTLTSTQQMLNRFVSDLSDADLLVRPVPGANHIAWQLGHLIDSECNYFGKYIPGAKYPELPAGFSKQHNKEMSKSDSTAGFCTRQQYVDLYNQVRGATLAAVEKLTDSDFDKPTEPGMTFFPTVGSVLLLHANHAMMHAGQFTVVRRKLGKPVLF
jgi:hypothetical protein